MPSLRPRGPRGGAAKKTRHLETKNGGTGNSGRINENKGDDRLNGKKNSELAVNSGEHCILEGMPSDKR